MLGIGFAAVSSTLYINGNVNILANSEDFDVRFTRALIDGEDKTSESISADGKAINFTTKELQVLNDKSVLDFEVINNSYLYDAEVSIECTSGERGAYYQITKEVANIISAKTVDKGKVEVQKIKVTTKDIEEAFTCTLTAKALERTTKGEATLGVNKNIVNSDIECLKNKEAGSCAPETEIRYMVNDTTEKTFYVLHDDGEKLTLQQNEDTVEDVGWCSSGASSACQNTTGPTVALSAIESATSEWNNVNTLDYEMGKTIFSDNEFTGCDDNLNCSTNIYTFGKRNAKARMITVQEAKTLNCTKEKNSCVNWLFSNSSIAYWTMNVRQLNGYQYAAWIISNEGKLTSGSLTSGNLVGHRARAVIEINK